MSRTATTGIDYTSRDYEGFREAIITELGVNMPEYTDRSQTDAGIQIIEGVSKQLDVISYYTDTIANETLLPTLHQRDSATKWCNILSYIPRAATPSRVYQVFALSAVKDAPFTIPAGTQVKTVESDTEPSVIFETESDLVIPAGKLGNEQDVSNNYLYAVPVVQGYSVTGELLGSSGGTESQKFVLSYSPVIASSVQVLVNEGSGFTAWAKVDSFIDSGPSDRHFTLTISNNDEAVVTFGDGVFGKIPTIFDSGIFANYRVGGGTAGNVGANKIVELETSIADVDSTFNPASPFENGTDKETVDEIKVNAPKSMTVKWGALTLQDFSDVVLINYPDVVFANSKRDVTDTDSIHIYLVTKDGCSISSTLMSSLTAFFDENSGGRKIVGANQVSIEAASAVAKDLSATLIVKDRYSRSKIETQITALLTDYFAVGNYPFGKDLSLSELAAYVMSADNAIDGIKSFVFTSPAEQVTSPAANEIFTLGTLTLTSSGGVA